MDAVARLQNAMKENSRKASSSELHGNPVIRENPIPSTGG
jgi:hypothetical protein